MGELGEPEVHGDILADGLHALLYCIQVVYCRRFSHDAYYQGSSHEGIVLRYCMNLSNEATV